MNIHDLKETAKKAMRGKQKRDFVLEYEEFKQNQGIKKHGIQVIIKTDKKKTD